MSLSRRRRGKSSAPRGPLARVLRSKITLLGASLALAVFAAGVGVTGCELVAGVDRTLIPGTGGAGGTGGSTASSPSTSSSIASSSSSVGECTGGMAQCGSPSDCPMPSNDCLDRVCNMGCCSTATRPSEQKCTSNGGAVCDGAGNCVTCVMALDCPPTGTVCATPSCAGSACGTTKANAGDPCSDSGGVVCDGLGKCVAAHCTDGMADADETDKDCGGSCSACGDGLKCKQPGDCASLVCTGNVCIQASCNDGVQNGAETDKDCGGPCPIKCPVNEHCGMNVDCASDICLGNNPGTCVACNVIGDCTPTGNECVVPTCVGNACGTANLDNSHTLSTGQNSGNCQRIVCDGNGGTTSIDDASDPPPAAGTVCLTSPMCSGAPLAASYTPAAANVDCTADNKPPKHLCGAGVLAGSCVQCNGPSDCAASSCIGSVFMPAETCSASGACVAGVQINCAAAGQACNAALGCVACNQAADCPATGNECIVPTCVSNACGTQNLGQSHALSVGQTAGDCQKIVCDGSGGTTSIDDVTDLPVSNTVCKTSPACVGSPAMASFTAASTGTSCVADNQPPKQVCGNTSNGTIAGTCVQCNTDTDCLGINDAGTLTCNTAVGICQ